MRHITGSLRLMTVLALAVILSLGSLVSVASAQRTATASDTYVSELSEVEIEVSGDFTISDSGIEEYPGGTGELIDIESPTAFYQVAFYDDEDDPEATIELFNGGFSSEMDSFEVLDSGGTRGSAWNFALAAIDDSEFFYLIHVTPDIVGNVDLMEVVATTTDQFVDEFEAAQESILIDGEPIFVEFDLADIEDMVDAAGSTGTRTSTTETETETESATETETDIATETETETDSGRTGTVAGDVFVSDVTGAEIEFGEPFTLGGSDVFGTGQDQEESITLTGPASNISIGFFLSADAESTLEGFLEGFDGAALERTNIDSGYEDGIAWTLDEATLGDGTEAIMYLSVDEEAMPDHMYMTGIVADARFFSEEFEDAQSAITVDGDPIFADVDIADLEDLLGGGSSRGTDTDTEMATETETATDETALIDEKDNEEEADSRRDRARLPGGDTDTDTDTATNETETGTGTTGGLDIPADLADAGLVSATEYVSPQFDTEVVWGDLWFADLEDPETALSERGGMDSLSLIWGGEDFSMVFVDIATADGLLPEDFVDYWLSDEYLQENADADAEILLDDALDDAGAVVMVDYLSDGEEIIVVKEAVLLDGGETIAIVTLIGFPEAFGDTYADAEGDIQIDDMSALNVFSSREIDRALP